MRLVADRGMRVLMGYYRNGLIGSSWWQAAVAQSTLETYERAVGSRAYGADIVATYNRYVRRDPFGLSNFRNGYMDDTAWWGLAWLQEYRKTRQTRYLEVATADADYIHRYWTGTCGGGVLWTSSGSAKNAIANGLFLQLTAWLAAVIPGDTAGHRAERAKYLSWANAEWRWYSQSGLIRDNVVVGGLDGSCRAGGQGYTYSQGVLLAGLGWLYKATGRSSLRAEAVQIARAAIAEYTDGHGVLFDPGEGTSSFRNVPAFKGIFVRDLALMAQLTGTTGFFTTQASSIRQRDTSTGYRFGVHWAGPLDVPPAAPSNSAAQASAEQAVVAALLSQSG